MNTNKLSSSGLKQTSQRKKILEFIESSKSHPTADEIFTNVRKDIPNVSRTTIYNTVNKLAKEGIIKCMNTKNGEMHFDACLEPQYHFMCDQCGAIYDLGLCSGILQKEIDGHEIKDIFICYNGICKECRRKNENGEIHKDDDIILE